MSLSRMSLYPDFKKHVLQNNFFKSTDSLLVAVSGGLDSIVLLNLLKRLSALIPYKILVVHVNYHLRGKASDLDETLVRRYSSDYGFSLEVLSCSLSSKKSLQDQARNIRFDYFEKMARKHRCTQIVLAHHLQDQAETFLIKLLQGAGLQGLKSMEAQRNFSVRSTLKIIRPLLVFPKEALKNYAQAEKLKWREDASNRREDYLRNVLRLRVLPLFQKINPQFLFKIGEAIEVLQFESEWMEQQCKKLIRGKLDKKAGKIYLPLEFLKNNPISMRNRIYSYVFKEHLASIRINRGYLKSLDEMVMGEKKQMKLSFSGSWGACLEKNHLVFRQWRLSDLEKRGFFR